MRRFTPLVLLAALAGSPTVAEPLRMGPPLGVSWGTVYGFPPDRPEPFVPQARALGASFTRLTLYWSQLEPRPGEPRWVDLDSYLDQLARPEEGFLTLEAASPWATRTSAMVFPSSPAKDAAAYYAFVHAVVAHAKGRIRYFQSDQEPNNPFFWRGSAEEFAAQQWVFYKAVKDADPDAIVVLGGCDGLFDPTGAHPVPGQDADMAFFSKVIAQAVGAYDVFDLRLYGDAYTIGARADFVRQAMAQAGGVKPIVASEYSGPGLFEFPGNRRWAGGVMNPTTAADRVAGLTAARDSLPVEMRMFLPGASVQDRDHFEALAADDLVIRNVLALAAGVQKTAFFDLSHTAGRAGAGSDLMFDLFKLLGRDAQGALGARLPLGEAYARLAGFLDDATFVERVETAGQPDLFVYRVTRRRGPPLWIVWRRPPKLGEAVAATPVPTPAWPRRVTVSALMGTAQPLHGGLSVGASPVFVEAGRD